MTSLIKKTAIGALAAAGAVAAVGVGALALGAIAAQPRYSDPYYGAPGYGAPAPAYYDDGYDAPPRRCWRQRRKSWTTSAICGPAWCASAAERIALKRPGFLAPLRRGLFYPPSFGGEASAPE